MNRENNTNRTLPPLSAPHSLWRNENVLARPAELYRNFDKQNISALYYLELFRWALQPSSYDNSSWWGGGVGGWGGTGFLWVFMLPLCSSTERGPRPNSTPTRSHRGALTTRSPEKILTTATQSSDEPCVRRLPPRRRDSNPWADCQRNKEVKCSGLELVGRQVFGS